LKQQQGTKIMMTRKHFEIVAEALLEADVDVEQARSVAKALKEDSGNPRFDENRFVLAAMNWE
tara:strand:- start:378 stop:566 length:189 start_codon:yes stop_codon:yes gene_type:complete